MTDPNPRLFLELIRAVARLALPAADQLAYLRQIGVGDLADELALDHDTGGIPTFVERGWLTDGEAEILVALDRLLEAMSGPDHGNLWYREGLETDPRWAEVRQKAREFLFRQGQ